MCLYPKSEKVAGWLKDGPLLLDGGGGTSLHPPGIDQGPPVDLWNLTFPDQVLELHRRFVAAGSDVILTNSFGANRFRLARFDAAEKTADVNRRAAEIARAAAGRGRLVFGSIGPAGVSLAKGEASRRDLFDAFVEQARALADAGVDGLVIETMTDTAELYEAVRAAKGTGLPVAACMTFGFGKENDLTAAGVTPEEAAEAVLESGADIVGANCGAGTKGFLSICRRFRAACGLPIWMKPSAGIPRLVGDKLFYDQSAGEFAAEAVKLFDAGALFVGGCCGASPAYIEELRKLLDRRRARR